MPPIIIVLSAPSGSGKTTIARYLLEHFPRMRFSVSATTRAMRQGETDGKDYHFLSKEEFRHKIDAGEVIEYEEIYGNYYGTLRSEVERAEADDAILLCDVDVLGAKNFKREYPRDAHLIFIAPPSLEAARRRLEKRGTESAEQIQRRMDRAAMEMEQQGSFDHVIVNDDLGVAQHTAYSLVTSIINAKKER